MSPEDKICTPIQGLRQKLRIALRKLGVVGKIKTAHHRRLGLIAKVELIELDLAKQLHELERYKVSIYALRKI